MPSPAPILKMKNDAEKIRKLISVLRGPRGCGWDRRQTSKTLAPLLIEEAYEAVEAIESGGRQVSKEEIGDLLFLLLSIIVAAESKKEFSYKEIVRDTVKKYISRHPHVFAVRRDMTPDQILVQWEKMKAQKSDQNPIDKVPLYLPALYQAKRLYDKASLLGLIHLRRKKNSEGRKRWGRKFLTLVRRAVENGIDPEVALRQEIRELRKDFKRRFESSRRAGSRY